MALGFGCFFGKKTGGVSLGQVVLFGKLQNFAFDVVLCPAVAKGIERVFACERFFKLGEGLVAFFPVGGFERAQGLGGVFTEGSDLLRACVWLLRQKLQKRKANGSLKR